MLSTFVDNCFCCNKAIDWSIVIFIENAIQSLKEEPPHIAKIFVLKYVELDNKFDLPRVVCCTRKSMSGVYVDITQDCLPNCILKLSLDGTAWIKLRIWLLLDNVGPLVRCPFENHASPFNI